MATINIFDRTLKVLAFHYAETFLRLAFPGTDLELIGHETNVERDLIRQEEDPRKRGALLATAMAIASRFFDREFLWRFFREEVEEMRNASIGEQIGERIGERNALTRLLARRFGQLPTRLNNRLESLTVAQLEELIDYAVVAPDLSTFEQRLPMVEMS